MKKTLHFDIKCVIWGKKYENFWTEDSRQSLTLSLLRILFGFWQFFYFYTHLLSFTRMYLILDFVLVYS